jgi:Spy/CpxP family protein refolding chaperone
MQKIILIAVLVFVVSQSANAQDERKKLQEEKKTAIAGKIAGKMKDSLSLDKKQEQQIYDINVQIADQKAALRKQYPIGSDSLRINTQRVENTRDEKYKTVLTERQYMFYQQKKRNLINNN